MTIRIVFNLSITPSKLLLGYFIAAHSLMLWTLLMLFAGSWGWSCLAILIILLSFIYFYRQSRSLLGIARDSNDNWYGHYQGGTVKPLATLQSSIVTPRLVILYFAGDKFWRRSYAVTILADMADADLFRKLRLYCRDVKTFQR